jgi:hypothetical protein
VLPPFTLVQEAAASGAPAPQTTTVSTPIPEPVEERAEVTFANVRADAGRVMVVDLLPASAVTWDLRHVAGTTQRLSLPAFTFDAIQLHGSDRRFGALQLSGSRRNAPSSFELSGEGVPLPSITPYLQLAGLPYSFVSGNGSFTARGSISGKRWSAEAEVTLRDAALAGAEALQMAIGMPFSSALATLRDVNGDIPVRIALASSQNDSGYADQVAAGIRNTIRGVTGAAVVAARNKAILPIVDVPFAPGQVQMTARGMQEIAPVADLLSARPGLVAELSAEASQQDRRWLAEQALLPRLEDGGGFRGVLRALGMQDARARIRTALAARARGAPGLLDADDEALLTRMLAEAPPVAERQLAALRDGRMLRVMSHLAERYGVSGGRVIVRPATPHADVDLPAVHVQVVIGTDGSPPPDL